MTTLIRQVYHPGRKKEVDLLIEHGVISAIGDTLSSPGAETIDGRGYTLMPALIDIHAHTDKAIFGHPWFRNEMGPNRIDRITYEREHRIPMGLDPYEQTKVMAERFLNYGVLAVRDHIDVDPVQKLRGIEGALRIREEYRELLDMQIVAFPQSGLASMPGVYDLMDQALSMGADLVGGIDPCDIDRDPKTSIRMIFDLAEKHDKPVDIHLHEPDTLGAFSLSLILERVRASGMQGRVTISHAFCLGMSNEKLRRSLLEQLAEQDIRIVTCAQAGLDQYPDPKELEAAGVQAAIGNDNGHDLWTPFGTGDMLERAQFAAMKYSFRRDSDLEYAFSLCTDASARFMGMEHYGIETGCRANLLLVRGSCIAECVAMLPQDRIVIRGGRRIRP